jgi:phytoene synthase
VTDAAAEALLALKPLDREAWAAALWAPAPARAALAAALALDRELERVVATLAEPLLAEVRLAWWRDQLERLDRGEAPAAQPLLRALASARASGLRIAPLMTIEDALLPLLSEGHRDAISLSAARGTALAGALAGLAPGDGEALVAPAQRIALARLLRLDLLGGKARASTAVAQWLAGTAAPFETWQAPVPRLLAGLDALALDDIRRMRNGIALATPATPGRQWRLARAALGFAARPPGW